MRVLLVAHRYLPTSRGGVEVWTQSLARGLARRGHDVHVLARNDRPQDAGGRRWALDEAEVSGVSVFWLRHRLDWARNYRETWYDARLEEPVREVLRRSGAEVLHLGHPDGWGTVPLRLAQTLGCTTAITVHDYSWLCGRGQMLRPPGQRCARAEEEACIRCLEGQLGRSPLRAMAGRLARRVLPAVWTDETLAGDEGTRDPGPTARQRWRTRQIGLRSALESADLVTAPSQFVIDRLRAHGIQRELHRVSNGVGQDEAVVAGPAQNPSSGAKRSLRPEPRRGPLRVGFFGNPHPSKGLGLLLAAAAALPPGCLEVEVHGCPIPRGEVMPGQRWLGPYRPEEAAARMASVDLVALPSLWDENQPIVALEARSARRPLLVSRVGGLPELVEDGVDGWVAPENSAQSWAEVLALLAARPQQVARAQKASRPPPSEDAMAAAFEALYQQEAQPRMPERIDSRDPS